jgi:hypothetical protein
MSRTQVFSNGGGTQSTAVVALIVQGKLPHPDYVVTADTGREKTATWEYMEAVHRPALAALGIPLVIVPHSYSRHDMTKSGHTLMPMYTTQNGAKPSKLPAFCSNEWKQRPVRRWLREQGVTACDQWMGISIDESDRMKVSDKKWIANTYPLIDQGMSRDGCYALVREMGWPDPPKSSCYMCPHMGDAQWRDLRKHYPADYQMAVQVKQEIRQTDAHAFLHRSAVPLGLIDWDAQRGLFEEDELTCNTAAGCWV